MEPIPGIRTMDALGRLVLDHFRQERFGMAEPGKRCP